MTRGFVDTGRFDPILAIESDPTAAAASRPFVRCNQRPETSLRGGSNRRGRFDDQRSDDRQAAQASSRCAPRLSRREIPERTEVPNELDPADVVVALVFVAPTSTGSPDGTLVRFVVRDPEQRDEPIIDA
jgi:hypothetical protein